MVIVCGCKAEEGKTELVPWTLCVDCLVLILGCKFDDGAGWNFCHQLLFRPDHSSRGGSFCSIALRYPGFPHQPWKKFRLNRLSLLYLSASRSWLCTTEEMVPMLVDTTSGEEGRLRTKNFWWWTDGQCQKNEENLTMRILWRKKWKARVDNMMF